MSAASAPAGPPPAAARVLFVVGAPGAGKSAVAAALLARGGDALVFDADWLLAPASDLVGRSLVEASDRWPAYGALWLRVLAMVARNGQTAVHFGTVTPDEAEGLRRQIPLVLDTSPPQEAAALVAPPQARLLRAAPGRPARPHLPRGGAAHRRPPRPAYRRGPTGGGRPAGAVRRR